MQKFSDLTSFIEKFQNLNMGYGYVIEIMMAALKALYKCLM